MTLPALRIILADLAKCIPETVLPDSTWDAIFGKDWRDDGFWPPQVIICDRLGGETGHTIKWEDAMKWQTIQDVLDYLEAREAEERG